MIAYRAAWLTAVLSVSLVGVLGTSAVTSWEHAGFSACTCAAFGGAMGWAVGKEFSSVRRSTLIGAALFGLPPLVLPGLLHMLGPAGLGLAAVLLLASPPLVRLILSRLRRSLGPPEVQRAAVAGPEEALRRQWMAASVQLDRPGSVDDRLLLVELRAQILDDLMEQGRGQLPGYVWESLHGQTMTNGSPTGTDREGHRP